MELTSAVPKEASLFGIGEHISSSGLLLRREGAPLTLWNRDNAASDPDQNTYGSWPFLLDVRPGAPINPPPENSAGKQYWRQYMCACSWQTGLLANQCR